MGHYPSEQVLKIIKEWDISHPIKELIDLLQNEWEYADVGYFKLTIRKEKVYLQLHTAGWSGNEDIYDAFEQIKWIGLFWEKSIRGGHYWYVFPRYVYDIGLKGLSKVK